MRLLSSAACTSRYQGRMVFAADGHLYNILAERSSSHPIARLARAFLVPLADVVFRRFPDWQAGIQKRNVPDAAVMSMGFINVFGDVKNAVNLLMRVQVFMTQSQLPVL